MREFSPRPRSPGGGRAWVAALALAVSAAPSGRVLAQAIERNLPPAPEAAPQAPLEGSDAHPELDERPIGPPLRAIVLLGPDEPLRAAATGVEVADGGRVEAGALRRTLAPYLATPLSRRLIAQVQAEVARLYRRAGFPFVSVSTPEQEITAGVLQLRVVEYRLGEITVRGGDAAQQRRVRDAVRAAPGQPIDAPRTLEDLDWLNRDPFLRVRPVVSPGAAPGLTDLSLTVEPRRSWRVYAGAANSGSAATGWERIFVGAAVGRLPVLPNAVASYQFTSSADFWFDDGWVFHRAAHPRYVSHAARLDLRPWPRSGFELAGDVVETNQSSGFFASRLNVAEASLSYRAALSDLTALSGDIYAGVEAKRERSTLFFGGQDVLGLSADVIQAQLGWNGAWNAGSAGRMTFDFSGRYSPGGLGDGNGDGDFVRFTQGRVRESRYAYGRLLFGRTQRLPRGFAVVQRAAAQLALDPLPDTEQLSLGGTGGVRGYSVDDGGYDAGVVLQNELRAPELSRWRWRLSPYLLLDAAYLKDQFNGRDVTPLSLGLGADLRRSERLAAGAALTYAATDAPSTSAGDWRLDLRMVVSL